MWIRNRSEALLQYGHIRDWDTSGVSDMSELFVNLCSPNEDFGGMNKR